MQDLAAQARRIFDLAHAHNWEALGALYSADAEYVRSDGSSHGRAAIVDYIRGVMEAFPDHACRVETLVVSDGTVTMEWTETGTHLAPYNGAMGILSPTGKTFTVPVCEVIRFHDGLIVSQHEYYDLLAIMGQVGWLEALLPSG